MLGAFLTYGIGSTLAVANTSPGGSSALLLAGTGSMLLNSLMVITIGVLVFPIVGRFSRSVASIYLGTRIFEGLALGAGAVALLTMTGPAAIATNFVAYNVAMAGLGIGSLAFCLELLRSGLAPRFLALWGLVGYASFAAGCLLELAGVTGAGLVSAMPGAGFEVTFGIWLIVKGFRTGVTRSAPA
ncbi:DUF4386 domain-containing protein [Nannocystis sp. ILAH1]|uniref:DUF4386 domain-containing protein n=1 Tax=unclassified Nannocystis TaxID=2627009 RepID=UPI00227084B6|nr:MULTISPECIES: DUF4386 domain-containing protein [unclassified Nannocystis]MCY0994930.1 DUF4386 domain-containing protein [Nannocystis sp. ILAH1]MCY1065241.1 DUF4386 domain-containing protein [Nannocystis sp. RBIL2]